MESPADLRTAAGNIDEGKFSVGQEVCIPENQRRFHRVLTIAGISPSSLPQRRETDGDALATLLPASQVQFELKPQVESRHASAANTTRLLTHVDPRMSDPGSARRWRRW